MSRRTFNDWLDEVRFLVVQNLEKKLEDIPEFDVCDARAYYKGHDAPIVYFEECLSESCDDDTVALASIMGRPA